MINPVLNLVERESSISLDIEQLNVLAVRGLKQMFDAERQLFCFRLKRSWHGMIREGLSHRYTIISLLGLRQLETRGYWPAVEVKRAMDALLNDTHWINNIGDLGLLLWLCALVSPERLKETYTHLDVQGALERYRDARAGRTMELAWFLTGLSHGALACREALTDVRDVTGEAYRRLIQNQGTQGIFGHVSRKATLIGVLRGRIGSFADQVYPIYALTKFAQAYHVEEALRMAVKCAEALCRVQGPLGQWWWHYDASTGRVLQGYPVYSVHQHGMGPMALLALGEASGLDFSEPVGRGVQWISHNEGHVDLRDASTGVIWRSLYRKKHKMYFHEFLSLFMKFRKAKASAGDLEIRFECRPYELGWLLYALADQITDRR